MEIVKLTRSPISRLLTPAGFFAIATLSAATLTAADLRLVEAAKNRDRAAVRSLLEQKVDVNASQPDGATALAWAAHWNELETADLLIRAGADVNAANDYGVTPLSLACAKGYAAMVEKLLDARADPNRAQLTAAARVSTSVATRRRPRVRALRPPHMTRTKCAILRSTLGRVPR